MSYGPLASRFRWLGGHWRPDGPTDVEFAGQVDLPAFRRVEGDLFALQRT